MRQNAIVALLSVIATLLAVLVFSPSRDARGQGTSGGTATVGTEVAVATGSILGGSGSAFWLYEARAQKLAVYFLGNTGLELRAVRDLHWDLQIPQEYNTAQGKQTKVSEVKKAVMKAAGAKKKAEEEEGEE